MDNILYLQHLSECCLFILSLYFTKFLYKCKNIFFQQTKGVLNCLILYIKYFLYSMSLYKIILMNLQIIVFLYSSFYLIIRYRSIVCSTQKRCAYMSTWMQQLFYPQWMLGMQTTVLFAVGTVGHASDWSLHAHLPERLLRCPAKGLQCLSQ